MTVSAAAMAGALAIALMAGEAPRAHRAAAAAPSGREEAVAMSFRVRFQGQGPIARAARAGDASAERVIATQLERQIDLGGLCFAGFAGNAEIVLRSCDFVTASERHVLEQRWLQRLRSMRGVAYAEIETAPLARAAH